MRPIMEEVAQQVSWTNIYNDPRFSTLSTEEKNRVAENYFSRNIASDPRFPTLPKEKQDEVRAKFYQKAGLELPRPAGYRLGKFVAENIGLEEPEKSLLYKTGKFISESISEPTTGPAAQMVKSGVRGLASGATSLSQALYATMALPERALGMPSIWDDFAKDVAKYRESLQKKSVPEGSRGYAFQVGDTLGQMLTAYAIGGARAVLPAISTAAGVLKAEETLDSGHPLYKAFAAGLTQAGIEYATEKLPLEQLMKPGLKFFERLGRVAASDIPGELLATASEMYAVDEKMLGGKYSVKQYQDALIDTLVVAGAVTGLATTAAHPLFRSKGKEVLVDVADEIKRASTNEATKLKAALSISDVEKGDIAAAVAKLDDALMSMAEKERVQIDEKLGLLLSLKKEEGQKEKPGVAQGAPKIEAIESKRSEIGEQERTEALAEAAKVPGQKKFLDSTNLSEEQKQRQIINDAIMNHSGALAIADFIKQYHKTGDTKFLNEAHQALADVVKRANSLIEADGPVTESRIREIMSDTIVPLYNELKRIQSEWTKPEQGEPSVVPIEETTTKEPTKEPVTPNKYALRLETVAKELINDSSRKNIDRFWNLAEAYKSKRLVSGDEIDRAWNIYSKHTRQKPQTAPTTAVEPTTMEVEEVESPAQKKKITDMRAFVRGLGTEEGVSEQPVSKTPTQPKSVSAVEDEFFNFLERYDEAETQKQPTPASTFVSETEAGEIEVEPTKRPTKRTVAAEPTLEINEAEKARIESLPPLSLTQELRTKNIPAKTINTWIKEGTLKENAVKVLATVSKPETTKTEASRRDSFIKAFLRAHYPQAEEAKIEELFNKMSEDTKDGLWKDIRADEELYTRYKSELKKASVDKDRLAEEILNKKLDEFPKGEIDELYSVGGKAPREYAPLWYLKSERVIEQKMPEKATPEVVMNILKSPQNGVKAEELKWLDIEEWLRWLKTEGMLDSQEGKVSKSDVLEFIKDNSIMPNVIVKQESGDDDNPTLYRKYTLPGGTEYTEILYQHPTVLDEAYNHAWEEPNIIGWARTTTRNNTDGESVLFIEEIQTERKGLGYEEKGEFVLPFRKSWHEYVLKNLIRDAAARGYDRLAWINGVLTAHRYKKLSWIDPRTSTIDAVGYRFSRYPWGVRLVIAGKRQDLNLKQTEQTGLKGESKDKPFILMPDLIPAENLSEGLKRIGIPESGVKSIIDQISSGQTEKNFLEHIYEIYKRDNLRGFDLGVLLDGNVHEVYGWYDDWLRGARLLNVDDINISKISSEWAARLYDQMIPQFLKRYGKAWGVDVEKTQIKIGDRVMSFLSIPITEEMRESVLYEGQPLFQKTKLSPVPITEEQIKDVFPEAVKGSNNIWLAPLPNGGTAYIQLNTGHIAINESAFERSYQRPATKEELDIGAMAKVNFIDRDAIVHLAKGAGVSELSHEKRHIDFRIAMELSLTKREIDAVLRKYGNEAAASEAYAQWDGKQDIYTPFQKILNFFRNILKKFGLLELTAEDVFARIEKGQSLKQTGQIGVGEFYSVIKDDIEVLRGNIVEKLSRFAQTYIDEISPNYDAWSKQMKKEFGDKIETFLKPSWELGFSKAKMFQGIERPLYDYGDPTKAVRTANINGQKVVLLSQADYEMLKKAKTDIKRGPLSNVTTNFIYLVEDFDRLNGTNFKGAVYLPARYALNQAAKVREQIENELKQAKEKAESVYSGNLERDLGLYGNFYKQSGGMELADYLGMTQETKEAASKVEKSPEAMDVYNRIRAYYEYFYNSINKVRVALGEEPIPYRSDYAPYWRLLSALEEKGFSVLTSPLTDIMATISEMDPAIVIKHPKTAWFPYIKRHKVKSMVSLDFFSVFDKYSTTALNYIYLSPVVARTRALAKSWGPEKADKALSAMGLTENVITERVSLQESTPYFYNHLQRWTDSIVGIRNPNEWLWAGRSLERAAQYVSNSLAAYILGFSVRSILVQPSALANALPIIGPKYLGEGVQMVLSPKEVRRAFNDSKHLKSRRSGSEVAIQDAIRLARTLHPSSLGSFGETLTETKDKLRLLATKGLVYSDLITATSVWLGAYKMGVETKNLSHEEAVDFADDIIVKTQGSAAAVDRAPIQRTPLGKTLTLFGTFQIAQFNLLAREIAAIQGTNTEAQAKRLGRIMWFLIGTSLVNALFEDILKLTSPMPTPIRAIYKSWQEEESKYEAIKAGILEVAEISPIITGSLKYGSSPLGAGAELLQETAEVISEKEGPKPSSIELAGKWLGVPGGGQLAKSIRQYEEGGSLYDIVAGTYPNHTSMLRDLIEEIGGDENIPSHLY